MPSGPDKRVIGQAWQWKGLWPRPSPVRALMRVHIAFWPRATRNPMNQGFQLPRNRPIICHPQMNQTQVRSVPSMPCGRFFFKCRETLPTSLPTSLPKISVIRASKCPKMFAVPKFPKRFLRLGTQGVGMALVWFGLALVWLAAGWACLHPIAFRPMLHPKPSNPTTQ